MALADIIHFSDKLHKFNLFIILTILNYFCENKLNYNIEKFLFKTLILNNI